MDTNGTMDAVKQSVSAAAPDIDLNKVVGKLKSAFGLETTPWWKKPKYYIPAAFIGGIAFAKSIFGSKRT